jgi:hypothetical protein
MKFTQMFFFVLLNFSPTISEKCPGGVAQWTSHPPDEKEDPGSNPAVV